MSIFSCTDIFSRTVKGTEGNPPHSSSGGGGGSGTYSQQGSSTAVNTNSTQNNSNQQSAFAKGSLNGKNWNFAFGKADLDSSGNQGYLWITLYSTATNIADPCSEDQEDALSTLDQVQFAVPRTSATIEFASSSAKYGHPVFRSVSNGGVSIIQSDSAKVTTQIGSSDKVTGTISVNGGSSYINGNFEAKKCAL